MNKNMFFSRDGNTIGPFTESEVDSMLAKGQVRQTDLFLRKGVHDWIQVGQSQLNARLVQQPVNLLANPLINEATPQYNFRELVRQVFTEKYSREFEGFDKLHMLPNLPSKKLANVLNTYAEGVKTNDILLLFDNTVLGSANDGFLMTDEAIYWHNAVCPYKTLDLTALDHVKCENSAFVKELYLNHTDCIKINFLKPLEAVTEMLKEIASLKNGDLDQHGGSHDPDTNVPEEAPREAQTQFTNAPTSEIQFRKLSENGLQCNCSFKQAVICLRAAVVSSGGVISEANEVAGQFTVMFSLLTQSKITVTVTEEVDSVKVEFNGTWGNKKKVVSLCTEFEKVISSESIVKRLKDPTYLTTFLKTEKAVVNKKAIKAYGTIGGTLVGAGCGLSAAVILLVVVLPLVLCLIAIIFIIMVNQI
jgi:hypothetical protein